jgi:acetyltransferase-like isoleucine patch superfamily enzyme
MRSIKEFLYKILQLRRKDPKPNGANAAVLSLRCEFPVGKHTYQYEQFCVPGMNIASIGAFCSFGPDIKIVRNHPTKTISTHPFFYRHLPALGLDLVDTDKQLDELGRDAKVIIRNDVWVGCNAVILPSVVLGNGVVVGAGAIVTKSVPDYAIVAGVPARIIRYRFKSEEIEMLNAIQWWDWPDEQIRENIDLFACPRLFFERCGRL